MSAVPQALKKTLRSCREAESTASTSTCEHTLPFVPFVVALFLCSWGEGEVTEISRGRAVESSVRGAGPTTLHPALVQYAGRGSRLRHVRQVTRAENLQGFQRLRPTSVATCATVQSKVRYVSQSLVFIDFPYQEACVNLSIFGVVHRLIVIDSSMVSNVCVCVCVCALRWLRSRVLAGLQRPAEGARLRTTALTQQQLGSFPEVRQWVYRLQHSSARSL